MADRLDWITPTAVPERSRKPPAFIPPERSMSFPYKPRPGRLVLAVLFFGFGGWLMNHAADTNDRGLILEHLIYLSPEGACVFYRIISWLCFGFVILAVLSLPQMFLDRRLVLEKDAILIPRGWWSNRQVRIPLDSIYDVQLATYRNKYRFITIYYNDSKAKINATLLPNPEDYQIVMDWISRFSAPGGG